MRICGRLEPPANRALRCAAEDHTELSATEHTLGFALQLANALAGDSEFLAELGEGRGVAVAEAVAPHQDMPVTLGEPLDSLLEGTYLHLPDDRACHLRGTLVLDQLSEFGAVAVRGEGLVEAGGVRHGALDVEHLADGPLQASGDLFVCGLAAQLGGELVVSTGHLPDLIPHMHGNADGTALVRHRALHGLPYPPRGVRGEPPAAVGAELLYGPHQADVALLDQILERQPHPTIPLGNTDHQPEVLLDELLTRPIVTGLGPLAEVDLLPVRKEIPLVDAREVPGDEVRGLRRPLVTPPVGYPNSVHQMPPRSYIIRLLRPQNPALLPHVRTPRTHRNAPRGRHPSLLEIVWVRECRLFLGSCQTSSLHISERLSRSLPPAKRLPLRLPRPQATGFRYRLVGFRGPPPS